MVSKSHNRARLVYIDRQGSAEAWSMFGERVPYEQTHIELASLPVGVTYVRQEWSENKGDQEMQFKKRGKKGVCRVMRCTETAAGCTEPTSSYPNGVELCKKHAYLGDASPVAPATIETTTTPATLPAAAPSSVTAIAVDTSPAQEPITAIVAPIKEAAQAHAIQLQGFQIINQAQLDIAGSFLQKVKADYAALEATRTAVTKPMNDAKRQIDAWFKPAKEALQECERHLKAAIAAFTQRVEDEKVAALNRGDTAAALATPTPELPSGVQSRNIWRYEVEKPELVPREFLTVDHKIVAATVTAYKDQTNIPGIRVFRDQTIAAQSS